MVGTVHELLATAAQAARRSTHYPDRSSSRLFDSLIKEITTTPWLPPYPPPPRWAQAPAQA